MDFREGVPTIRALLREPLPGLRGSWLNRLLLRTILLTLRGRIREIEGLGHLAGVREPFILVANHTTYLEAFLVPVVLCFLRRGRRVRFLADWMFFLIPGISSLLRRAGIIPVRRKPARWRGLNRLKNLVVRGESGYRMALLCLRRNEVIGVYPEGKAHGSSSLLLRGAPGAARLEFWRPRIGTKNGGPLTQRGCFPPRISGTPGFPGSMHRWTARLPAYCGSCTIRNGYGYYITDVFEGERHSPYNFHTRVLGFQPVATHDTGEMACNLRRITLLLNIRAAYRRLRLSRTRLYEILVGDWPEDLHRRLIAGEP